MGGYVGLIKVPEIAKNSFLARVHEIFEDGSFAEGPRIKEFEELVCWMNESQNAIACSSNGTGIVATLQCMGHLYGSKYAIIQGNTFYGVKTMTQAAGFSVVDYIDCNPETLMPTVEHVRECLVRMPSHMVSQTVAILTHIGGFANPEIVEICDLLRSYNVKIIEDNAHSWGVWVETPNTGRILTGNFGDAGVFSFYSTKAIPGGEGGVIVTNDSLLSNTLKDYVKYDRFNKTMDKALNVRISDMHALFLTCVTHETNEIVENKTRIAEEYKIVCNSLGLKFLDENKLKCNSNFYKFIIIDPPRWLEKLDSKFKTSPVYDYEIANYPLSTLEGCKKLRNHICLPTWYAYEDEKVKEVCEEIIKLYKEAHP